MPAFFCELFSEEIPAGLQKRGAGELSALLEGALAALLPKNTQYFWGPRRIAVAFDVDVEVVATSAAERGPRVAAPEAALAGFLRKHGADKAALRQEGDFWVLDKATPAVAAADLIAAVLPGILWKFPWPKSMRWGGSSAFTWVRPLRRIVALLDGAVVPFALARGDDDGHGLVAGDVTEGHRFMSPAAVTVRNGTRWREEVRARHVVVSAMDREMETIIEASVAALAKSVGSDVVSDPGLVTEVAGLVEWPVPLLGRIDEAFMDLPPEVMQVSMRVNQRYFALRKDGQAAPYFAFVANIAAPDGGAAIIAGNERVLRARFADARHFWDQDRTQKLEDRVAALDRVVFQARLGSQGDRVRRLVRLAGLLAPMVDASISQCERAALLAKADLVTGMVGEFPELQGVMGGYYARHDGEADVVADAIADHYLPKGPNDPVPAGIVGAVVALADKIDQLVSFFGIGEKPTGSGDPYALRRAALGVIRIIRAYGLRLGLGQVFSQAGVDSKVSAEVIAFVLERLRVQLRADGARHDVLVAVYSAGENRDDDLVRLLARAAAVEAFLATEDGRNLLAAYKRAANILRIEERQDGVFDPMLIDAELFEAEAERALYASLNAAQAAMDDINEERFDVAMSRLARLRAPLDAFFENVTVNADAPLVRANRLRLLSSLRYLLGSIADFGMIESGSGA